jgi:hypothetical protein
MSSARQTVITIRPATTDCGMRLGLVLFVRGPLRVHAAALDDLWTRLNAGLLRRRVTRVRHAGEPGWTTFPDSDGQTSFTELFGIQSPLAGRWGLEIADMGDANGNGPSNLWLQLSDLAPVRGMERASHIRVLFPEDTPAAIIAGLGEWAVNRLGLWWGSGGFVFHHTTGTMVTAHTRIAALAKRYWAVQILDMPTLQWEALAGLPSVNWLTLIGEEFAQSKGGDLGAIVSTVAEANAERIAFRRGPHGVAIAAGAEPRRGDINAGENLDPYVAISERLQPFLMTSHPPLFGPFARPEVMAAWLTRFSAPDRWLMCDIAKTA